MGRPTNRNRPYDDKGNPNSFFSDDSSSADEVSNGRHQGPSSKSVRNPLTMTSPDADEYTRAQHDGAARSDANGIYYPVTVNNEFHELQNTQHTLENDAKIYSEAYDHEQSSREWFDRNGLSQNWMGGQVPVLRDDVGASMTTPRNTENGATGINMTSTETYNPEPLSQVWLGNDGFFQGWADGPDPVSHDKDVGIWTTTPLRNKSNEALQISNDTTTQRRTSDISVRYDANRNETLPPHTIKGGFSSVNMLHGAGSFNSFVPTDADKRFTFEQDYTMSPGDSKPYTESDFMAQMEACSRKASDPKIFDFGRSGPQRLQEETLRGVLTTPPNSKTSNRTPFYGAPQSPINIKNNSASKVRMLTPYRQEADPDRPRPRPIYSQQYGGASGSGFGAYNCRDPTQAEKNAKVHAMVYENIWRPESGAGNDADQGNAPFPGGSLLYGNNFIPHGIREDFLANPTAYVPEHEVNDILGGNIARQGLPDSLRGKPGNGSVANSKMGNTGPSGSKEWELLSGGGYQGATNGEAGGSEFGSDFELTPLPLPRPNTGRTGRNYKAANEDNDDNHLRPDNRTEESDWEDVTTPKRKRGTKKESSHGGKINKNGQPRKSRAPRPQLRKWDQTDVNLIVMGIVWSCGEMGIQIPFEQAAQLIDETCSASALQQAILKIHAGLINSGIQLPKIKMNWPKKGLATTGVVRDASKVPRRKPTMRKSCQSYIITLKRAYIESDRAHLASPYTPNTGSKYKWHSLDPRAMNAWATPPTQPPLPPYNESPFAKTIPSSSALPLGFTHDQDPFQIQGRLGTPSSNFSPTGVREQGTSPAQDHKTEKEYYDCRITSSPLNPQNLTADQVLHSRYRRSKFVNTNQELASEAAGHEQPVSPTPSGPSNWGGNLMQNTPENDCNASLTSGSGKKSEIHQQFDPQFDPEFPFPATFTPTDPLHTTNMFGVDHQPYHASSFFPAYGGIQDQSIQTQGVQDQGVQTQGVQTQGFQDQGNRQAEHHQLDQNDAAHSGWSPQANKSEVHVSNWDLYESPPKNKD